MKKNKTQGSGLCGDGEKKRTLWNFQPDADVKKLVEDYLAKHPGLDRTEFLNNALKLKFPDLFLESAERDLENAKALVEDLKRTSSGKRS